MNPKMFFIFFYATTILLLLFFEKLQIAHNIFGDTCFIPIKLTMLIKLQHGASWSESTFPLDRQSVDAVTYIIEGIEGLIKVDVAWKIFYIISLQG